MSTGISWADETWNPIRAIATYGDSEPRPNQLANSFGVIEVLGWACQRVSPGCVNCYAAGINKRLGTGLDYDARGIADSDIYLDERILTEPLRWKRPRRVFVCSMTDLFGEWVPDEWLDRIFAVMALASQHTFQLLTKRPERMRQYVGSARARVAALLYNATCEQRADDPFGRAIGATYRRGGPGVASSGAWRPPGSGRLRSQAVRATQSGVSTAAGLPTRSGDALGDEVRDGSASTRVDSSSRSDSAGADRQSPERGEGRQPAGEPRTGDGIGEPLSRAGNVEREAPSPDWLSAPENPHHRGGRDRDPAATGSGRDGEGNSGSVLHEAEGGLGNLQPGDLEAHLTWPLPNVWLGASAEDQDRADERIPELLGTPAAVRFLSCEPLLGPVDLATHKALDQDGSFAGWRIAYGLHWVIVGGESGQDARPFDLAWARSVVQQCQAAGTAVFVKQLGAKPLCVDRELWERDGRSWETIEPTGARVPMKMRDPKGGEMWEWPEDLRVREYPEVGR